MTRGHALFSERGFTLIEILLAVAILATVAALVGMSFASTFRIMDAIDADGERDHVARTVFSLIADEVTAGKRQGTGFLGRNGTLEGQPSDVLAFVTTAHIRSQPDRPESDVTRILYAREGGRLIRYALRNLQNFSLDAVDQVEMAQGVSGFNVRFLNRVTQSWVDEWNDRDSSVPLALMVELTLLNAANEPRSFTEWIWIQPQQ